MKIRSFGALVALVLSLGSGAAHAVVISGSFEGVADGVNPGGPFSFTYRGTFSIDTEASVDPSGSGIYGDTALWLLEGDGLTLEVEATPPRGVFNSEEPRWLYIANYEDRQEVSIQTGVFFGGSITLVSTPGGLVDGFDFRTFHPGPVDVAASRFSYTGHQETGGGHFTSFRFDAAPIPEPSTWALMLGGLAALAVALRRRVVRAGPSAAALTLAGGLLATPAHALVLRVDFVGVGTVFHLNDSQGYERWGEAPATGSLLFDLDDFTQPEPQASPYQWLAFSTPTSVAWQVGEWSLERAVGGDTVTAAVESLGAWESLTLNFDASFTSLVLRGDLFPGSLVTSWGLDEEAPFFDLRSFTPAGLDVASSTGRVNWAPTRGGFGSYADLRFDELRVSAATTPVPEPHLWVLMLAGLGAVWLQRVGRAGRSGAL